MTKMISLAPSVTLRSWNFEMFQKRQAFYSVEKRNDIYSFHIADGVIKLLIF